MTRHELVDLEVRGWEAPADTPEAATALYERTLDDSVVMLLPGGLRLDDRAAIVGSMGGRQWTGFVLEDPEVLEVAADVGLVSYGVLAHRDGSPHYCALVSSLYVRRAAGWKLAFHQQTPRE